MLNSFKIGSYRGMENVELKDFANINMIVGMNNAGKTSVMEAIILSGLFDDGELLIQTLISRYQQVSIDLIKDLFSEKNVEQPLICLQRSMSNPAQQIHTHITYQENKKTVISNDTVNDISNGISNEEKELLLYFNYGLENDDNAEWQRNCAIFFNENDNSTSIKVQKLEENDLIAKIPCQFISFSRFDRTGYLMNALDKILEQDKREALIQVLQLFDPHIVNFEVIGKQRNIKIFADNKEMPLSLYDYGNGMYKAFYIASAALLSENGMLLVDEIEAGIHKTALRKFIAFLSNVCQQRNIQLFITTHSLETVDLFLEFDNDTLNRIAAYNLHDTNDGIKAVRYSGSKLAQLRRNMGVDIR